MRYFSMILVVFLAFGCAEESDGQSGSASSSETGANDGADGSNSGETQTDGANGSTADGQSLGGDGGAEGGETPATCECVTAEDCLPGQLCVGGGATGACKDYPPAGLCWTDEECPFGAVCEGASPCGCDAPCVQDEPGTCSQGSGCCGSDADCIGGDVCVNSACKGLVGTMCWRDDDCGLGQECVGSQVCECGTVCVEPDSMGSCFPAGAGCCLSDLDCNPGSFCLGDRCVEDAVQGQCWEQGDCAADEMCTGAATCACSVDCGLPTPGACEGPQPCCSADEECPEGKICAAGGCKAPLDEGKCWGDADCGEGQICTGGTICDCGTLCASETPGICVAEPQMADCCATDAECEDGKVCVGTACHPKPALGACYGNEQCGEGEVCEGALPCNCGQPCVVPLAGQCVAGASPDNCCAEDAECGEGLFCLDGACYKNADGTNCWQDSDCFDVLICEGANLCPCEEGSTSVCLPSSGVCAE